MITQTQFKSRSYTDEDLQAVCDLLNACDAVDKMDDNYDVEDLRLEFESPELDKSVDLRLWEDESGRLVGFGQTWIPKQGEKVDTGTYIRMHPDFRDIGIEDEIIAWAADHTREVAERRGQPALLRTFTRDHNAYQRAVYERNGFKLVRYFFLMVRPLNEPIEEPVFPEGYKLRHTQGRDDVTKWVDAFNMSFIDHWAHHPATVENHGHWLTHRNYKPERDLVAEAPDGTFAAFCFCWIDPEHNARNNSNEGWIEMLGTRRGHRKLGLGRAMLLSGLRLLKEEGAEVAKLGVDAENPTGALRLYESVGFRVLHTSVSYHKEL